MRIGEPLAKSAHVFVAVVFTLLGLSFMASTALLIQEFRDTEWQSLVISHSHLFIFFPTLGIFALAAFYLPSVIFTEFYWFKLGRFGKLRFFVGGCVVVAGALYFANSLGNKELRAMWEVAPAELKRELAATPQAGARCTDVAKVEALRQSRARGEPDRAVDVTKACSRQPILKILADLRDKAQRRSSLSEFSRNCSPDPLLEVPDKHEAERYCFPASAKLNATDCCRIQGELERHVAKLYAGSSTRSESARVEQMLLIAKVFFILVLFVIGIFLLVWRNVLKTTYASHLPAIERGVVLGAIAILFWVLMDYGYQQTTDVLYGRHYEGINLRLSLSFVPWALLLLFYFMARFGKDLEKVSQIATIVGTGYALLRFQQINDISVRLLGSGAAWWHFVVLGVFCVIGLALLSQPFWRKAPLLPGVKDTRPLT